MNHWATAGALLAAAGIAIGLRCPRLSERPMHNDEGVNAVKFGELWTHGVYKYDPSEYHGPSLPYATLLINRLTGGPAYQNFTETRLRAVTVVFGVGLILLYLLLRDGIGAKGVAWAGIFTAVSPAMVYYSRYYIHEILLVFFTGLSFAAGWRYWRTRKIGWAVLCGASVGFMYATKETFILTVVACALALILNQFWNRKLDATGAPTYAQRLNMRHVLAGIAACATVWLLLFSSFFTNSSGLRHSISTYAHWFGRSGTNGPHVHEWSFYFHRLLFFHAHRGPIWSEALIVVLAFVGAAAGFARKGIADGSASFVRFLSFFTLILAAIYSALSYKTPWCLLSFWLGFILLAGVGASVLITVAKYQWARAVTCVALGVGAAQLGAQAWQASLEYGASPANPYVYAHTSEDILQLVGDVESVAKSNSEGHGLTIKVVAPEGDYWPLPWYFRKFEHIGWYANVPEDPIAPIIIASPQLKVNLDQKDTHTMVGIFQLRPNVFFELYVENALWKARQSSKNE
jgi:uncharacterized protein (TIGR03663 family)